MILDKLTEFSDAQAITVATTSTNVINLYVDDKNLVTDQGIGEDMWITINSLDPAATGKLTAELITSDKATMATPDVLFSTGVQVIAGAGRIAAFRLPSGKYKRYIALRYTPDTPVKLVVHAGMAKDIDANIPYASGSEII